MLNPFQLNPLAVLVALRLGAKLGPLGGLGAVWGHRGIAITETAGVSRFRDPYTGAQRVFGTRDGGLKAARAAIDAAKARCG